MKRWAIMYCTDWCNHAAVVDDDSGRMSSMGYVHDNYGRAMLDHADEPLAGPEDIVIYAVVEIPPDQEPLIYFWTDDDARG